MRMGRIDDGVESVHQLVLVEEPHIQLVAVQGDHGAADDVSLLATGALQGAGQKSAFVLDDFLFRLRHAVVLGSGLGGADRRLQLGQQLADIHLRRMPGSSLAAATKAE